MGGENHRRWMLVVSAMVPRNIVYNPYMLYIDKSSIVDGSDFCHSPGTENNRGEVGEGSLGQVSTVFGYAQKDASIPMTEIGLAG